MIRSSAKTVTPLDKDFDFVVRFDKNIFSKDEVNRVCNKLRALLVKEGFQIEKASTADKNEYANKLK